MTPPSSSLLRGGDYIKIILSISKNAKPLFKFYKMLSLPNGLIGSPLSIYEGCKRQFSLRHPSQIKKIILSATSSLQQHRKQTAVDRNIYQSKGATHRIVMSNVRQRAGHLPMMRLPDQERYKSSTIPFRSSANRIRSS